jgi:hypothetical protein
MTITEQGAFMRAETASTVEDIEDALALLRRHL